MSGNKKKALWKRVKDILLCKGQTMEEEMEKLENVTAFGILAAILGAVVEIILVIMQACGVGS